MTDYETGDSKKPSNVVRFSSARKGKRPKGRPPEEAPIESVAEMIDSATRDLHAAACTVQRMIYLARDRCGLPQI